MRTPVKSKQKGAALAIGMMLMLIISSISITAMKTSLMEEKMAAGLKNREIADSAALSLLSHIEGYLFNYYLNSNGTALQAGSPYILIPRSEESNNFRNTNSMEYGYSELNGTSINSQLGGILSLEPRFIIEEASNSIAGKDSAGNSYAKTGAEDDNAAAASSSNGGATGDESNAIIQIYRIMTKSTDTTGFAISAFESVMSVQVR